MNLSIRHSLKLGARLAAAFAVAMLLGVPVANATFPEKPIRLVVPFSLGGGTVLIARTLAVEMAKKLGQPVAIKDKPGTGTIIGTDTRAPTELG